MLLNPSKNFQDIERDCTNYLMTIFATGLDKKGLSSFVSSRGIVPKIENLITSNSFEPTHAYFNDLRHSTCMAVWPEIYRKDYLSTEVAKDGNCFYSSISFLLFGGPYPNIIKFLVLLQFVKSFDDIKPWLKAMGITRRQLLLTIVKPFEYAESECIFLACQALKMPIIVIQNLDSTLMQEKLNRYHHVVSKEVRDSNLVVYLRKQHCTPIIRRHNSPTPFHWTVQFPMQANSFTLIQDTITVSENTHNRREDLTPIRKKKAPGILSSQSTKITTHLLSSCFICAQSVLINSRYFNLVGTSDRSKLLLVSIHYLVENNVITKPIGTHACWYLI